MGRTLQVLEAFVPRLHLKKLFMKIFQNLQKNTGRLRRRCFPVNFARFLQMALSKWDIPPTQGWRKNFQTSYKYSNKFMKKLL